MSVQYQKRLLQIHKKKKFLILKSVKINILILFVLNIIKIFFAE